MFVPYVAGRKEGGGMRMLGLRGREDYEGLERDRWGIPSLKREGAVGRECADGRGAGDADADGSLDLVVMPGVAFDGDGRRLGHGKGYYDRFLTSYAQSMEGSPDSNSRKMPRLGRWPQSCSCEANVLQIWSIAFPVVEASYASC